MKGFGSTNSLSNSIHDNESETMDVEFRVNRSEKDFKVNYIINCNECITKINYDKSRLITKKCNIRNNSNEIDRMNQISNFCLLISNSIVPNIYLLQEKLSDIWQQQIYEKNGTEIMPSTESNNK